MQKDFKCIVCGAKEYKFSGYYPRDRKGLKYVDCLSCGHRQLFPLLSEKELEEEYDYDKTVQSKDFIIAEGNDFNTMHIKWSEWTKIHADMYWDICQNSKYILNLGSGFGFLEEEFNKRSDKKFIIEGDEISKLRIKNYVGGIIHTINFMSQEIPSNMIGKYDLVMALHLLEHLNEPVTYLEKIKPLFTKNGKLLIEVPNKNCWLCELSPDYDKFYYLYEHVSYFSKETLGMTVEKAGYKIKNIYSKEIYSIENHINWIRTGKPFIKYNQMYLPDKRIEFINEEYKKIIGDKGKGYSLIVEATIN